MSIGCSRFEPATSCPLSEKILQNQLHRCNELIDCYETTIQVSNGQGKFGKQARTHNVYRHASWLACPMSECVVALRSL